MAQTPYLAIEQIAPAQDSPYLTANDAVVALEAAINRTLEVDLTGGAVELSQAQFTRYVLFRCSGHTTTTNLTIPNEITTDEGTQTANRLFLIRNAGTGNVSVTDGSASLAVEPSTTAIIVYDGTSFYVAASGASATNFTDLGDVPAAYTSAAGRQLRVNSAPDGIEFVATVIQVESSDVTNSENYTTLDFDDPFFTATASGGVVTFGIDPTALNITDLADMPSAPGPSQDGQTLAWNNSAGEFEFVDVGVSEVPVVDWKESVRVATTAAGTLASDFEDGDTVDGVTLSTGDRILVQDQASASENGVYTVNASGAPTRATDFDEDAEVTTGAVCYVEEGTANGGKLFILTTTGTITVGSTNLTFSEVNGSSGAENFTDLGDVPGSYSSQAGKLLAVTSEEDGIEFVDAPESGPYTLTENEQTGTTYTFVIGDANDVLVAMNNAAANTLTVPPNASVAFDVGTVLNVHQKGAGQTTLAEGSGVTISYPSAGSLSLREQNSVVSLVKTGTDTWVLAGDLEPAESGALDADQVAYDNTTSGLTANEVQAAIDEIEGGLGSAAAEDIGTSGDNVALLSGVNTWSAPQICAVSSGTSFRATSSAGPLFSELRAPSGFESSLRFQTGTSTRWVDSKNSAAESGSNAGSNRTISSFDDAGAFIIVNLEILRASGDFIIAGLTRPRSDNVYDLGSASFRWGEVFAATGTINTSDGREKTELKPLDIREKAVARRISESIGTFKWLTSIDKKGDDARIHVGTTAQLVKEAFEAEGLDATKYALWCEDKLFEDVETVPLQKVEARPEVRDEKTGRVIQQAVEAHEVPPVTETRPKMDPATGKQQTRLGLRYDQLMMFILSTLADNG